MLTACNRHTLTSLGRDIALGRLVPHLCLLICFALFSQEDIMSEASEETSGVEGLYTRLIRLDDE